MAEGEIDFIMACKVVVVKLIQKKLVLENSPASQ